MSDWLHGVEVPPLIIKDIRRITQNIRTATNVIKHHRYPIVELLEFGMPQVIDNFDWEVVDVLGEGREACCFPDGCQSHPQGPKIVLTNRVYEEATKGDGRSRYTIAHEIGHVFLHRNIPPVHNRKRCGSDLNPWENSEWQANTFAGELLMPIESFNRHKTLPTFCSEMGVSRQAARTQGFKFIKRKELSNTHWIRKEGGLDMDTG